MTPNLLLFLDDIVSVLDDVAGLSKVAAKKTAAVMGDDLALNAEQVTGVEPSRELAVVWAVTKGSFVNKAILVPAALVISAVAPWLIVPLLMIGGAFLCFEGFEKVYEKLFCKQQCQQHEDEIVAARHEPGVDLVEYERLKIKGAVRTDLVLSAEILVIALGTATEATLLQKGLLLVVIAIGFTIFVYGLVAGIVKLDDWGLSLSQRSSSGARSLGHALLWLSPWLLRVLGILGTAAMFLVGGGIITHGVAPLAALSKGIASASGAVSVAVPTLFDAIVGIALGGILVAIVSLAKRVLKRGAADEAAS
ncbi:MAG: DUF808 domain-containing protein [Polyangiaceae bacterium]